VDTYVPVLGALAIAAVIATQPAEYKFRFLNLKDSDLLGSISKDVDV
jgi:hypothetical protein